MHTCRQQHAPRSLTAPVIEIQHEAVVIPRPPTTTPFRTSTLGYAASSRRPMS